MTYKKRIEKALMKFSSRSLPKTPRKKKNQNLEGPVVLEIKKGLTAIGFDLNIIEAKATYNESAGRYISGQVDPGYPDLSGNGPSGESVFIEVKAKGKRSTLRLEQFSFLKNKIDKGCFAICADSLEYCVLTFNAWLKLPANLKKDFLLAELPGKHRRHFENTNGPLFD
jgi:hypothetical protein